MKRLPNVMRKTKYFSAFGNDYRIRQYSAADGLSFLKSIESVPPVQLLKNTYAVIDDGLICLDNRESINDYVCDILDKIGSQDVLMSLLESVKEFNFDFLNTWKSIKIPKRLCASEDAIYPESCDDPIISHLIASKTATLRELETYYSTEDAFRMYNIIVEDSLTKALITETAHKEAESKAKSRR